MNCACTEADMAALAAAFLLPQRHTMERSQTDGRAHRTTPAGHFYRETR
jgi:hypothetical protein